MQLIWYLFKKTNIICYLEHDLDFRFSLSWIDVERDDEIEQEPSFDWNKCWKGLK